MYRYVKNVSVSMRKCVLSRVSTRVNNAQGVGPLFPLTVSRCTGAQIHTLSNDNTGIAKVPGYSFNSTRIHICMFVGTYSSTSTPLLLTQHVHGCI